MIKISLSRDLDTGLLKRLHKGNTEVSSINMFKHNWVLDYGK